MIRLSRCVGLEVELELGSDLPLFAVQLAFERFYLPNIVRVYEGIVKAMNY